MIIAGRDRRGLRLRFIVIDKSLEETQPRNGRDADQFEFLGLFQMSNSGHDRSSETVFATVKKLAACSFDLLSAGIIAEYPSNPESMKTEFIKDGAEIVSDLAREFFRYFHKSVSSLNEPA
jgi:hypothetical protein